MVLEVSWARETVEHLAARLLWERKGRGRTLPDELTNVREEYALVICEQAALVLLSSAQTDPFPCRLLCSARDKRPSRHSIVHIFRSHSHISESRFTHAKKARAKKKTINRIYSLKIRVVIGICLIMLYRNLKWARPNFGAGNTPKRRASSAPSSHSSPRHR